jgi:hypothetical protein
VAGSGPNTRFTEHWVVATGAVFVASLFENFLFDKHADTGSFATLALVCIYAGAFAPRIWIVALAAIPFFVALPFGFPDVTSDREPPPIAFGQLFLIPFYGLLVGLGVFLGRIKGGRFASISARLFGAGAILSVPIVLLTIGPDPPG